MFRTKQDVDRHAANVLGRIKNEKEKNSRGYQIARLYFDVSEYEVAKRYLSSFLSVRETVPQAHKLMGHIFLKTNEKEKALACYKRALELDGTQKDLIIKICELCTQVPMDPERARFWLEKAEQTCPGNDVIFRLREMIAENSGDEDFQELENLITSELTQRPEDVSLQVKLLRLYLKSGKLDHAYNVAVQTDRTMAFTDSLEWYETLLDVYYAYKGKTGCRGDLGFYTQFLHTLRNVAYLRLCYREPVACAEVLHQFDQVLQEAVQIPKQQEDWMSILTEMTGQFFFFCGTLLLKRAQKGVLWWKDVIPLASVCYLLNNSIITIDSRSEWFVSASKDKKSMYEHLHMISHFRRSQGGHTLQALGKGDTATWTQKLRQQYCTQQGREKLYDTVFTQPDMRAKKDSSYLIKNRTYTDNVLLFPTRSQMRSFDSGCYRLHPHSLTNFIWLALQRYSCKDKAQPYYGFDIFEDLAYSVKNMSVGGAESLCQLDTDVFLIASVRCAALRHQEMIHMGHSDPTQPDFLPLSLTKPLCTQEQADWWLAAYKFHTNTVKDNFSKMRHTLQRGIETVRLVASHGVSVNLIIHIARSLEVKATEMKQLGPQFTVNVTDTETRAEFYWEQALEMLNRLEKNRNPPVPKHRLFKDDTDQDLDEATIKVLTSEVQYAVGCAAMKKHKYEEAINIFDKLHTPYASLNSAKIYKVLAEQERSRDAPVGREQHQILLTKARDAIYRTFDLLQGDKKHELNKSVQQHLDDIESQLMSVAEWDDDEEPSQYHTPTAIQMEGDVSSPAHSTPRDKSRTKSPAAQVSFNTSDAGRHIRPSPEHMDAKIRSLAYSQESLVKMVLARNEELVKFNSQLVEALRENREVITQLKSQLNLSQKYNYSSLSTPGPHMASPYHPPYPPPQGMAPAQFGYQMPSPAGLPGYRPPSPRSRSRTNLMGHTGFMGKDESNVVEGDDDDENPYFIDGEFFEESLAHPHGQYYVPDSHLEWPYGNRAGIEGSSTVTYAPQNRPQMPQSGFFASSLRGQSIQYGQSNIATSMPGPGYFSSPHGLTTASAINQTPPLYAAIMGKDSPHNMGAIHAQIPSGAPSPAAQAIPQYLGQPAAQPQPQHQHQHQPQPQPQPQHQHQHQHQPQPQPQPQPATTLASQMAQKPIFTSGNFGAGVKTASTPLTKATSPQAVPAQPQPFGQMPQVQAQNLVNRAVTSTTSPSASTAEVVCIFQGKATYTSKIGAKQEGNVKVFFFGAEKGGRVRMETLSTNQIILNHDINTLKLVAAFTPQLVTWKRPQHDGKGEETVNLNFENAELAQKLKSVIQRIQEAGKKSEASTPKPAVATSSPFTISGSQAFKPTTTQTPTGSSPAVFGQAQSGMPASAALAALSAKQGEEKTVQSGETPKPSFGGFTFSTTPVIKPQEDKSKTSPTVKLKESSLKVTSPGSETPAANQPKPFAGFTFTPTKPITPQAPVVADAMKRGTGDGTSSASTVSSAFTLGQNTGSPMPSFSNIAANTSATGFSGLKTGQHSFLTTPGKGDEEDKVEEYEPNVDFKPVIDLPDLVEMKTGEEDEEKVFGERARLFRFDADTNQWKERGIGEVKILFNKAAKRYRILMRREQVLKICANHNITKDMKLTPMTSSDRAWCWSAMDFAEEEMKMEKLAIKFKTPELAGQFKECFEKSQDMIEDSPVKPVPEAIGSSEVAQKKEDPKGKKSLADMFKPKTGSWECEGCYCVNKGEQLKCPACNTIKPGAEEEVKKAETTKPAPGISSGGFKIGEGGFQIGGGGGGGFGFGKKQEGGGFGFGSATSGGGFSFSTKPTQSAKDSPKETAVDSGREAAKNILKSDASTIGPGGFSLGGGGFKLDGVGSDGFSFSPKPSTPATPAKSEPADSTTGGLLAEMLQSNDPQPTTTGAASAATSGFCFPPKSSGFNFASAADTAKKDGSGGFQFNLGKVSTPVKSQEKKENSSPFQFTFSLTPSKTPQAKASVTSPKSPEGDYYVNKDGEDSHIYFEPIVSLPDKVDVKTGEEEEITRFEQRAKLFRFSEGEWKERGLGTMKILEHKSSHRYRLLMRREQIYKVCCNHVITPELELKPMASGDGKSWVWYAKDFSEEEGKVEQLAIKFKNKEIADKFKKEFDAGKCGEKRASAAATEDVSAKQFEVEALMTSSTRQVSGDSGNPYYKAELENLSIEPLQTSRSSQPTGDEGSPYYKERLDTSGVEEHMSSAIVQGIGDKGNPYYKADIEKTSAESVMTSTSVRGTGDGGNPYYVQHLDDSEIVEEMAATAVHGTGDRGNPYYKSGLDVFSVESSMTSSNIQGEGDKGNPYYKAELEKSGVESQMTSVDIEGTGNKGNPYYKAQLEEASVEPQMEAANIQGNGEKGNPYHTAKFGQAAVIESMSASKVAHGTGGEGNPYYSSELDRLMDESLLSSASYEETGDEGNPYYSSQLDQMGVEPVIQSSSTQRTGGKGNHYHTEHSDNSMVVETVTSITVSQATGEDGNPHYSSELDELIDEPKMTYSSSQGTGNLGNPYYSSKLNDTSGVEFLYVEEATEEQKARARKYLLPESFYLYENKPPCPGCIGCEDYDPSKVSVPSKVKAKSKSEETSPAPTRASVQVSSSAGSVAGSTGASEGFCMFGQASGMSFSTLAAQGDAVGYAFKKDENRPFQWSGAGQQIFGTSPGGNRTNVDDDEVVQSDDIDFKPIIDLPELVEVKTGEEGWEVVYCQRSKLFRFVRDSNQWKERAVGDMKILKQDDKYRLLMRRDQVHKVACNHLIAGNMTLSPMSTSETAWCWTAQDYAENEAKVEQFALRFKTEELARQFKKKFEEVQELVRATESASPAKNTNNSATVSKSQDVSVTEEEEEEDDDSEEESIVFEKRATLTYFENDEWKKLGMGNLKILYNDDLNGNQIDMETDDKQKICNHVICREHSIKLENQKRACMWSAQDFSTDEPVRRDFKAAFSSVAAAEEFAKSFMEGVSLARDSELSEKISHEMDTPVIFSHGDATGGQTRILVSQSEASSATSMGGSSQCETRIQPGESEGSQSAASSQTGEGVSATDASSVVSCSPELSALLSSFLEEDQKR